MISATPPSIPISIPMVCTVLNENRFECKPPAPKPTPGLCHSDSMCFSPAGEPELLTCLSPDAPVRRFAEKQGVYLENADWSKDVYDELHRRVGTIRCENGKLTLLKAEGVK